MADILYTGDRVVKNPETWEPSEFDAWGAGVGVGVVLGFMPLDEGMGVDVRWPAGRCVNRICEVLKVDTRG